MPVKDLSAYLAPNLELPWNGRTFVVPPPTKDVGLKLAAVNAAGVAAFMSMSDQCPTCGRSGAPEELPERTKELLAQVENMDLGELSLGPAYREMVDAGVPAPDLAMFEVYALYYWTLGEEAADQIMAARQAPGGGSPKDHPSPSKSGRSTAKGSRSRTSTASRSTGRTSSRKS